MSRERSEPPARDGFRKLWTVRDVLGWTADRFVRAGLPSARLDAEVLLGHALGCARITLYTDFDRPLSEREREAYRSLVARRLEREPVAYLVGYKEFFSRRFLSDPRALIPRPETEHLVEAALGFLRDAPRPRLLDVGTGCGAIAVTLAAERPDAEVVALERSPEALALARENAAALGVEVRFVESDLLGAIDASERFDIIAANLPYVAEADRARLEPELGFEPAAALFAPGDGLGLVRDLIQQAPAHLAPGGRLLLEIGLGQCPLIEPQLGPNTLELERTVRDLAGIERVMVVRRCR